MKVKEKYSPDFKNENDRFFEDIIQKELKVKDNMTLFEIKKKDNGLFYSKYLLYDDKYNVSYVQFFVPNPRLNDKAKDFYLKYQQGARTFMEDFFDVYVGDKEDLPSQFKDMEVDMEFEDSYEETGERSVILKIIDSDILVGIIELSCKEKSVQLAKNIINYFAGNPIEFNWKDLKFDMEEVCEQ